MVPIGVLLRRKRGKVNRELAMTDREYMVVLAGSAKFQIGAQYRENLQPAVCPQRSSLENRCLDQHQTYKHRDIYYDTAFQQSDQANARAFSGRTLHCLNGITSLVFIVEWSAVTSITGTQKHINHKVAAAEQLTKINARMTRIRKKTGFAQNFV